MIAMSVISLLPVSVSITASANPVCAGTSVTYTATPVNGGANPAYQWKKNGSNITGATNVTYSYIPVNNDLITCALTSNAICVTGNPATSTGITMTVTTLSTLSVSIAASANPACPGATVTFTATPLNGGASPAYQWKKGGTNIPGATNVTYSYVPAAGDAITCAMTSSLTSCITGNPATSNTITMVITTPVAVGVSISANANTVCAGTTVTFTAIPVNGGSGPAYQWLKNGVNITGATNVSYAYTPVNNDAIACKLTSNLPCVTGNPATSSSVTMMVIPSQPVSISIVASANPACSGTSVTFTSTIVNGGTTPAYQWKLNGTNISGGTGSTYTYIPANGDQITCVLTSNVLCGTGNPATSNVIAMAVNSSGTAGVSITAAPHPVCTSPTYTFYASPTNGGANPQYQWSLNGVSVPGATSTTFITDNPASVDCQLTSNAACVIGSSIVYSSLAVAGCETLCYGQPISLYCATTGCEVAGATYSWINSSGSWISSEQHPIISAGATGYGTDAFYVTVNFAPPPGSVGKGVSFKEVNSCFTIGQSYGGGIIFYIDGTGQHGFIAATSDQGWPSPGDMVGWGCRPLSIPGTLTAIGTGAANTALIVANGCSDVGFAARICSDLVLNGYNDWFLPSKDELNQLYLQRGLIGGFAGGYYWCSTEENANYAFIQQFGTVGNQTDSYKDQYWHVRAIRAF